MVRRARFRASSRAKSRGTAPGELSTVPAAPAAGVLLDRAGYAEVEEPAVKQLAAAKSQQRPPGTRLHPSLVRPRPRPAWLTTARPILTWPRQNLSAPEWGRRRHWAAPRPSKPVAHGTETPWFG